MTIKKAYVDTPHGQVHCRYGGSGTGPPIVFLHQNVSSSSMFQRTLDELEADYRLFAIDTPGFGGSYDPHHFTALSEMTTLVLEAIDSLGIVEFHACGQHTGAAFSVEMAVRSPARLKSVMLIGPLLLTDEEKAWYRENFKGSAAPDAEGRYLAETWEYLRVNGAGATVENHHEEMWQALRAWQARGWTYDCVWEFDFESYFRKVSCPMLLMAAKDDVLYPGFERAAAARPEADTAVLKGSNFEANLDPRGTSQAIRRFLTKHGYPPGTARKESR
jgi:pimeloyl-ACP methyl ester carboxylesterase